MSMVAAECLDGPQTTRSSHVECTEAIDASASWRVRKRMALEYGKWDPQVGDVAALAPFALIIPAGLWDQLARSAERLAAEALAAERVLCQSERLMRRPGLPARLCRAADGARCAGAHGPRVIRFDFHPTPHGWRISEANSDVPGGYTEAAQFAREMAEAIPGTVPAGDPAARLVDAIASAVQPGAVVGLLAATGYMEDQQVTAYLARLLEAQGITTLRAHPRLVRWRAASRLSRAREGAGKWICSSGSTKANG
jgi:hypothetical protein